MIMKPTPLPALFAFLVALAAPGAALAAAAPSPAVERVTVTFTHPEKFADLKESSSDYDNDRGREQYLPPLQEYLVKEASRRLPADQKLAVEFTEIDLAGDFEPWHGPQFNDVRIVKDLYVPRLTFRFTLTDASGKVLKEGERKLVDLGFQLRLGSGFRSDSLRYEKEMLSDWLRSEFKPR